MAVGWYEREFDACGVPFKQRGKIFEDQIGVLRELWTKRSVTLKTRYHTITAAGICT